jgi:pimeloyl-ACP methyl ester carboxylesterase
LRRFLKFAVLGGVILSLLAGGLFLAAGGVAAENAMRPPRLPVALVCPCFAHMHCESVAIAARDGVRLSAWYYTPDVNLAPASGDRAILLLHGVGSNRQDMVALGNLFLRRGYSVLEPDLRGHGESGGLATYGVLEAADVRAWLDWLDKDRARPVYGFGASLGASVLLESLKEESRFRAVVAESPYYDFPLVAEERIARMLPRGTKWLAAPFVTSGIGWAKWHDGIDLGLASAAVGLKATKVPVLLIHGLADGMTSPDNSRRLKALNPTAQLWLVPGSGHADAWQTATNEFETRVLGWFSAN